MSSLGLRVLRFTNTDVLTHTEGGIERDLSRERGIKGVR